MKEIKEKTDNELIAEFMGFYITSDRVGVDGKPDRVWKSNDWPYFGGYRVNHLNQFETRWDWLMPVVEKINSMDKMICINFYTDPMCIETAIYNWGLGDPQQRSGVENNSAIESVYKAVIEFIKWYNTQESSKLV